MGGESVAGLSIDEATQHRRANSGGGTNIILEATCR